MANFLSKLAEKSETVYWLSSPDFKSIAYISPAYEKIWGRSRDALYLEPELWISYLHPDDVKNYHPIHAMAEKIEKQGDAARYEESYRIIRPDGEVRWIIDRGFPIYDETGACCGVTGVAIDITKEKQAEEALRLAKEEAEKATKLKSEFIRNMEHDVRTPFNGIWGLASYLWEHEPEGEKKELLGDITQSAKELLDYCNGILDFSRIEHGSLPVIEKKFDTKTFMENIIAVETPAAKVKKLELLLDYPSNIPSYVMGDQYRLQRILINLVSNAIKFTKTGYVKLGVKLAKQQSERIVLLAFSVEDTGIGIPQEKQDFIYEKFAKVNPSNEGIYRGSGLGLRIVKQFIEELNGEIDLESEIKKGSKFICTIPFKLPLVTEE
jgi:PAS domain S-box-containing protein